MKVYGVHPAARVSRKITAFEFGYSRLRYPRPASRVGRMADAVVMAAARRINDLLPTASARRSFWRLSMKPTATPLLGRRLPAREAHALPLLGGRLPARVKFTRCSGEGPKTSPNRCSFGLPYSITSNASMCSRGRSSRACSTILVLCPHA